MAKKIPVWTYIDDHIDHVAKFLNDHGVQRGEFAITPLPEDANYVRVYYLAAEF